jgi:hypothetical protein
MLGFLARSITDLYPLEVPAVFYSLLTVFFLSNMDKNVFYYDDMVHCSGFLLSSIICLHL